MIGSLLRESQKGFVKPLTLRIRILIEGIEMSESMEETQSIKPVVSFIMPGYNEEEIVGYRARRLLAAFKKAGHLLAILKPKKV